MQILANFIALIRPVNIQIALWKNKPFFLKSKRIRSHKPNNESITNSVDGIRRSIYTELESKWLPHRFGLLRNSNQVLGRRLAVSNIFWCCSFYFFGKYSKAPIWSSYFWIVIKTIVVNIGFGQRNLFSDLLVIVVLAKPTLTIHCVWKMLMALTIFNNTLMIHRNRCHF